MFYVGLYFYGQALLPLLHVLLVLSSHLKKNNKKININTVVAYIFILNQIKIVVYLIITETNLIFLKYRKFISDKAHHYKLF